MKYQHLKLELIQLLDLTELELAYQYSVSKVIKTYYMNYKMNKIYKNSVVN